MTHAAAVYQNENGQTYAEAYAIPENYNILTYINSHHTAHIINIFKTKKQSESVAKTWNLAFIANGNYWNTLGLPIEEIKKHCLL